ncbi:MAG: FKBP-type peptidyl-prolyl cis-trans isomerase [Bacteroidales bacterium]|nr:FKBP-type peptidyl-prolyl cis-trans isomerase [Bacteroidales bacterium]
MKGIFKFFLLILFLTANGCKKDKSEVEIQQEKLDNWMKQSVNVWANSHGYLVDRTSSGIYFISINESQGHKPTKEEFALVHFSIKTIDGKPLTTDSIEVAKASKIYKFDYCYGPILLSLSSSNTSALSEAILKMHEGSTARMLFTSEKGGAFLRKKNTPIEPIDLTLKLEKIYSTSDEYELGVINKYVSSYYSNPIHQDTYLVYQKLVEEPNNQVVKQQEYLNIDYMIWNLNNQLLGTNIVDSAKAYNVYDETKDYLYYPYSYQVGSSKVISAFSNLTMNMKYGESISSVFTSKYGYGENGSEFISGYCPLKVYIKIVWEPVLWKK